MNSFPEDEKRIAVKIRVLGESDGHEAHEWGYLQFWDEEAVIYFLQTQMRKSTRDARHLFRSYERFHVEMTFGCELAASRNRFGADEVSGSAG